ncbi:MAG: protein kinase, partial [Acidobacteriaceae bacterium]
MKLAPGTTLGPYEIVAPLGAGGMGEVYRASDPRLGRSVAIKVLPSALSSDQDRLRRFSLEARSASALNHPNIVTVFDIGSYQDSPYLVTELLEGQNLRELLSSQKQLGQKKVVDLGVQIANGLSAAHQKGIVHRDLKPENLFLCKDGRVKILDFGLAKLMEQDGHNNSHDEAPTVTAGTDAGTVLGTTGYMSPEQVRGIAADPRADIFSFGAILYELLSGQRAFGGESAADIASAILKEDPAEMFALNPQVSPALDQIVRHCLEKDPGDRFQSIKDLGFALSSVSTLSGVSPAAHLGEIEGTRTGKKMLLWSALALLLVASGLWLARSRFKTASAPRIVRSERITDFVGLEEFPAISPDGKSVAFVSDAGGKRQLWVRLLSGGSPLQLTHDAIEHLYPRWSHDSASLIYYSAPLPEQTQGMLWEISALGGFPRQLTSSMSGADVSHEGSKLAFFRLENGTVKLMSSDRDGSNPKTLLQSPMNSEQPSFDFSFPRWSPDDKWIAYQHALAMWSDDLYMVSASGGEPRQLTHEGQLMGGLTWTGDGAGIVYSSARGATVLYLPTLQLWLTKPGEDNPQQLTFGDTVYEHPDVSGGRVVCSRRSMQFDIWKYPTGDDPRRNVLQGQRITQQSGSVYTPTISPDDSEIAFLSDSGGHGNIWVKNLKTGDLRQITYEQDTRNTVGTPVWSPHSDKIAFATTHKITNWASVGYSQVDSDGGNLRSLVEKGAWGAWSGDGRFLYYAEALPTEVSKSSRLMKISVDGGEPVAVRNERATGPAPAGDGSALYYVMALENLTGGLDFEVREARPESGPSRRLARISAGRV